VIQEAKKAGIDFNDNLIKKKGWDNVIDPIVHDSIGVERGGGLINFSPGREFRWAGTDARGAEQFANFSHLKLNWRDTLQFQPEASKNSTARDNQKFELIERLSENYANNPSKTCGYVLNPCVQTEAIISLKREDGEGNPTIVYGARDSSERIKVKNYVQWLQSEGYGLKEMEVRGQKVNKK